MAADSGNKPAPPKPPTVLAADQRLTGQHRQLRASATSLEAFDAPYPPAEFVEAMNRIKPELGTRIVEEAMDNVAHYRQMQREDSERESALVSEFVHSRRVSQRTATGMVAALFGIAVWLVAKEQYALGVAVLAADVAGVASSWWLRAVRSMRRAPSEPSAGDDPNP